MCASVRLFSVSKTICGSRAFVYRAGFARVAIGVRAHDCPTHTERNDSMKLKALALIATSLFALSALAATGVSGSCPGGCCGGSCTSGSCCGGK